MIRLHGRAGSVGPAAHPVDLVEIEAVLRAHEQVHEVVVLAGGDGGEIEAYVEAVRSLRPADLASWCRRHLRADRVPGRWHLVPALPRTLNGKLVRDPDRLVL
jgi:acyl-coenzyme A synthetase/AMP-(fatty) acid ligase